MSRTVAFWSFDPDMEVTCPNCGWSGNGAVNYFDELMDVRCQHCDNIILLVPYPTATETRAAAAAGNPGATEELAIVEAREAFQARAQDTELKEPSQLPDLSGEQLLIEWDQEAQDGQQWTVLRCDGTEIWRELAYFEGYKRFASVFEILLKRYGTRLAEVRPTRASWTYLYGDALSAPNTIDTLNKTLQS